MSKDKMMPTVTSSPSKHKATKTPHTHRRSKAGESTREQQRCTSRPRPRENRESASQFQGQASSSSYPYISEGNFEPRTGENDDTEIWLQVDRAQWKTPISANPGSQGDTMPGVAFVSTNNNTPGDELHCIDRWMVQDTRGGPWNGVGWVGGGDQGCALLGYLGTGLDKFQGQVLVADIIALGPFFRAKNNNNGEQK
ncbi:hypothetical protein MKZ38_004831 [Zalerion maritima]|uniref:Uncharacterized protein n=1 Tax=Zalerion maritima TaxID=339359 RepID=A0AAD5WPN2_9PEZI|nr:hypothetical protein MKZ38_004831 [Zalerion maritima]